MSAIRRVTSSGNAIPDTVVTKSVCGRAGIAAMVALEIASTAKHVP